MTLRLLPYQALSYEQQLELLAQFVHPDLVKNSPKVKGPYTSGDYVEDMLRRIFGPDQVSIEILGNHNVNISDTELYAQAVIRLRVTFANGQTVSHDGIGVWPLKASAGSDLANTPSERYETAVKGAVTDAIKNAAEKIGRCFRPIADDVLVAYLGRLAHEAQKKLKPGPGTEETRAVMYGEADDQTTGETASTPAPANVVNGITGEVLPPDLPWCQWCGEKPSAPGVPCESCAAMGATPASLPSLKAKPLSTSPAPAPKVQAKPNGNGHTNGNGNGNGKSTLAKLVGITGQAYTEWKNLCAELVKTHKAYADTKGSPNNYQILGSAFKSGYPEITPTNMQTVIEALAARHPVADEVPF